MPLDDRDLARLQDIVAWGEEALDHLGDIDAERFIQDRKTYLAVLHCLQVVGEAAWSLSDASKRTRPTMPWPLIAGLRHRLVHDYGRIDPTRILLVCRQDLPALLTMVRDWLETEEI